MQNKLIPLGYLLGISLIIASIIYFFASNWPAMDRGIKISLSIGLICLFYGLSYLFAYLMKRNRFLEKWLLVSGCIAFGVSVALLGQIYNSHADSYNLYLIWLIPALLLSFITKYQPFFIMSYILFHLTYWFFTHPTSVRMDWSREESIILYLSIAAINIIIFILTLNTWKSPVIRYLSMIVANLALLWITGPFHWDGYAFLLNVVYFGVLAWAIYYFNKHSKHRGPFTLLSLFMAVFITVKYFHLAMEIASEAFFFFGLFFCCGIYICLG